MANNRMFMLCLHCLNDPEVPLDNSLEYIAKYYPNTGWYTSTVVTESVVGGGFSSDKRELIDLIGKGIQAGQVPE